MVNILYNQLYGLIIFSSIQMACPSIWNFYSSIRMANQTVQIIYSTVWMVCPSVGNFYSSVRMADQTVQIIHLFERLGKLFKHFKDCSLTTRHPCLFAIWTVFRSCLFCLKGSHFSLTQMFKGALATVPTQGQILIQVNLYSFVQKTLSVISLQSIQL